MFSSVTDEAGMSDLMNAGEVPGGKDERCKVGFGTAFSADMVLCSSSSSTRKAVAASRVEVTVGGDLS